MQRSSIDTQGPSPPPPPGSTRTPRCLPLHPPRAPPSPLRTDAYAKVRSSEGAEVARNQATIINDLQLGLPAGLAGRIEAVLLGPYLHRLTVTAADGSGGGVTARAAAGLLGQQGAQRVPVLA